MICRKLRVGLSAKLFRMTSENRYAPKIPSMLPMADPISRFRLIRRRRHSKITMIRPITAPRAAS